MRLNQATYVLVHGAWHGSWCWKRVRRNLQDAGHEVFAPTLTGVGDRSHLGSASVDLSTHITDIVNLLRWEDLSDVVLCEHSYGGMVISGVADQVPERIRTLVYLDAFVPEDGECVFDLLSQEAAEQLRLSAQTVGAGWNVPAMPAERFNVNSRDAAWVNAQCTFQSIASFEERIKLRRRASQKHDSTYVLASGWEWDQSPFRAAHERARTKGWRIRTLPCGHEAMLDLPNELTHLLLESASAEPSQAEG